MSDSVTTKVEDIPHIQFMNYTSAVKFPLVMGRIGGVNLPFTLSMPQLVTGLAMLLVFVLTRPFWTFIIPSGFLTWLFAALVIAVPTWLVRRLQIEGRSVWAAAAGGYNFLVLRGKTQLHGQEFRNPRSVYLNASFQSVAGPGRRAQTTASRRPQARPVRHRSAPVARQARPIPRTLPPLVQHQPARPPVATSQPTMPPPAARASTHFEPVLAEVHPLHEQSHPLEVDLGGMSLVDMAFDDREVVAS